MLKMAMHGKRESTRKNAQVFFRFLSSALVLVFAMAPSSPVHLSTSAAGGTSEASEEISITLHSQPGGSQLSGDGSGVASLNLGLITAFGMISGGLNRSISSDRFRISTTFGIKVTRQSGSSQSYTLMSSTDASSSQTSWELSGSALTFTPAVVALNQPYNTVAAHTLEATIPFTEPAGHFSRTIDLVAVPN
jgi:hypothetical protein